MIHRTAAQGVSFAGYRTVSSCPSDGQPKF
jgi:hypothetical protein